MNYLKQMLILLTTMLGPPTASALAISWSGDVITATCPVNESSPAPNITWFLGNEVLDVISAGTDTRTLRPLQVSTIRTVMYRMKPQDSGKVLKCSVSRLALNETLLAEYTIPLIRGVPSENEQRKPTPLCPPLMLKTARISCKYADKRNGCDEAQRPGTIASIKCKPGYHNPHFSYRKISCLDSGNWNRPAFECFPNCGRTSNSRSTLIAGWSCASVPEFPWQVAIYRKPRNHHVLVCSGTLIHTGVVLTAANCFWDDNLKQKTNISEYSIVVGKLHREWNESRPGMQKRKIQEVNVNDYAGRMRNFQHDIALVVLTEPIEITDSVNLACGEWDNQVPMRNLKAGNMGVFPGWGYMEHQSRSTELRYLELPFVTRSQCYDELPLLLHPLFTPDKFCAGYRNISKSSCRGDSGGGLFFKNAGRFYVRGVGTNIFKPEDVDSLCYTEQYTAFTLVSQYIQWIQDFLEEYINRTAQ